MLTYPKTLRWTLNGALIGFLITWIDMFVEWRNITFADWSGSGLAHNLGYFAGAMMLTALVGGVAGTIADVRAKRRGLLKQNYSSEIPEQTVYMKNLGVIGRFGVVLYWLGTVVCILFAIATLAMVTFGQNADAWFFAGVFALISIGAYLFGIGSRFILAGPKPKLATSVPLFDKPSILKPIAIVGCIAAAVAIGRAAVDSYRDPLPGLWGHKRIQFVEGAYGSCERTQQQHADNKGVKPEAIKFYCRCFSEGLADKISMDEL